LGQCLPVALVQLIEQLSAAFISQCFERGIHGSQYATIWLHIQANNPVGGE
jgi:hypothetical protein